VESCGGIYLGEYMSDRLLSGEKLIAGQNFVSKNGRIVSMYKGTAKGLTRMLLALR
jgi:hypothetical protein